MLLGTPAWLTVSTMTKVLVCTNDYIFSKVNYLYVPIIMECCYLEPRDILVCPGMA